VTQVSDFSLRSPACLQGARALMNAYYQELAAPGPPVAWCTSVGPAELLRAMGLRVYFPENHGAMLGASRVSAQTIPLAVAAGYSPEICSYLTSDLGARIRGVTPLTRAFGLAAPPPPDLLVYNTNQCLDVKHWFTNHARHFGVPVLGIHAPRGVGEVGAELVAHLARQHRDLAARAGELLGLSLDMDRLRRVTAASHRCSTLWREVLHTARARPAPLTFFDACLLMGPAVVLRGDVRAVTFYEEALAELRERVRTGRGAVAGDDPQELRLYWEGMPMWGRLRAHAELTARLGAPVVASTYCNSWVFDALGQEDPFEGMARAYAELFIARDDAYKEDYLARMMELFDIDGILFHEAKTCPANSNTHYGLPERLARRTGVARVVLHGDLCDMRLVSDEQTRTQVEALVEQLAEQRERL